MKGVAGRRFSLVVFGGTQAVMDIEPLVAMLRGWQTLHGLSHTLVGALVIALIATASGKPIGNWALSWARIPHVPITWRVALFSALVGAFSHVLLDAVMHADMQPLWPFSVHNPLLGVLSVPRLHGLCLALGLVGAGLMAWRGLRSRATSLA